MGFTVPAVDSYLSVSGLRLVDDMAVRWEDRYRRVATLWTINALSTRTAGHDAKTETEMAELHLPEFECVVLGVDEDFYDFAAPPHIHPLLEHVEDLVVRTIKAVSKRLFGGYALSKSIPDFLNGFHRTDGRLDGDSRTLDYRRRIDVDREDTHIGAMLI